MTALHLWAAQAWVDGRWQHGVALRTGSDGRWAEIRAGVDTPPPGATVAPGPLLPGVVDAHSHAFQRAFVGAAERRVTGRDDFWSWREAMYHCALTITPDELHTVATTLYRELLRGGYTQVCEFHYLHHADADQPGRPEVLAQVLVAAAADAGIGLTLLPTVYQRAGFTRPEPSAGQRRFVADAAAALALRDTVRAGARGEVSAGIALHSLRAATPQAVAEVIAACDGDPGPIHIHAAEQTGEVDDCLAATGCRPIEWLLRHARPDARWQLVHATHALPHEIDGLAATGAGIVLCPTTEGNLGDGIPDLPRWLDAGVPISLGSDSQVGRDWREELRWLEYTQRLQARRRGVLGSPEWPSPAERLFQRVLQGGGAAAGFARWGMAVGARADAVVFDAPAGAHTLDTLVFGGDARAARAVWVAGRRVAGVAAD